MYFVLLESIDNHDTGECMSEPIFSKSFIMFSTAHSYYDYQRRFLDKWERLTLYNAQSGAAILRAEITDKGYRGWSEVC